MRQEALEVFIGEEAPLYTEQFARLDEGKPAAFHWAAALFSTLWMAYRRMYLFAFASLALQVGLTFGFKAVTTLMLPAPTSYQVALAGGLTLAIVATQIYLFGRYGYAIYHYYVKNAMTRLEDDGDTTPLWVYALNGGTSGFGLFLLFSLSNGIYRHAEIYSLIVRLIEVNQ